MPDRREPNTHHIRELLTFWDRLYTEHVGARYPFNAGRDTKWVKEWRAVYSDDDLRTFMAAFFEIDDDFIENSGYGLGVFRGCLPKVIQYVKRKPKADIRGHLPPCRTFAECTARVLDDAKKEQAS